MNDRITIDPKDCHGKPVVRGTRTPVTVVLGALAGGDSFETIMESYSITIEDIRAWDPPVQGAILGVIEACHRRGEVLDLDYRAVLDAAEALALGMPWEDALRTSFFTPADEQVQGDASNVLDWLIGKGAGGGIFASIETVRKLLRENDLDALVTRSEALRVRPGAKR